MHTHGGTQGWTLAGTASRRATRRRGSSARWTRSCQTRSATRTQSRSSSGAAAARGRSPSSPSATAKCVLPQPFVLSPLNSSRAPAQNSLLFSAGPTCPACKTILRTASLQTQLETQIRARIARYYEGWTVCDDPTCGQRTRMMGVYGRRCLRPGCQGHGYFCIAIGHGIAKPPSLCLFLHPCSHPSP